MKTWSIYKLDSGYFTGRTVTVPEHDLASNIMLGEAAKTGVFDRYSQRVDVATEEVVDYQPESPGPDYEWTHDDANGNRVRRWALKPEVAERNLKRAAAQTEIAQIEIKGQRALREAVVALIPLLPAEKAAKFQRVIDMDRDISTLAVESGLRGDSQ